MSAKICLVKEDSIAEELGIEVGDILLSINNSEVKDVLDYRFLIADEYIEVEIENAEGEVWTYEIEKEYQEDLGIEFETSIMDKAKSCCNKCIFCFIDQLPKGMRDTLYFKDDDSRLSFLQGNFVTLTNMSDEDIDRIIRYRISPINVSVHTTNPELRVKMLNNRFAGNILERLTKLAEAGIVLNCQIVCVPGVNNGEELIKTVEDLYKLHPSIENVAVVPIGATKYREGLFKVTLFNKESAKAEIANLRGLQVKYQKEIGTPFVRLSDEFYILSGEEIPEADFYEGFEQLEDGVGMVRMLRDVIENTLEDLKPSAKGEFTLVTGTLAYNEILKVAKKIESANANIKINVRKIINHYFGETITVAGLLTGGDIVEQIKDNCPEGKIIIPKNMLKNGEEIFLDDMTLQQMKNLLARDIIVCDYTGEDLIEIINDNSEEE